MQPSEIIRRVRGGEPSALQYIYNHHKAYCLRRLVRDMGCPPNDAEDIFMDAILIFRQNIVSGKLKEIHAPRAYLYRTCQNRYQEQLYRKRKARENENGVRDALYNKTDDENTDTQQRKAIIMQAFKYLGYNCRQVLQFYYFDKLPLEDIAQRMGMANANVVKVTKSRCYKKWVEAVTALKQKK